MTKVKFISTISKMGDDRVIRIPRKFLSAISAMEGKDIRVVCDDEI